MFITEILQNAKKSKKKIIIPSDLFYQTKDKFTCFFLKTSFICRMFNRMLESLKEHGVLKT